MSLGSGLWILDEGVKSFVVLGDVATFVAFRFTGIVPKGENDPAI